MRQAKQMGKAAQLARHLERATSKALINIIHYGVMNCPVSATDIRNKEAAKGVSICELLEKTGQSDCPSSHASATSS